MSKKTVDEIVESLIAAKQAAVNTAADELEFADNQQIADVANMLLARYKKEAKAELAQLLLEESLVLTEAEISASEGKRRIVKREAVPVDKIKAILGVGEGG